MPYKNFISAELVIYNDYTHWREFCLSLLVNTDCRIVLPKFFENKRDDLLKLLNERNLSHNIINKSQNIPSSCNLFFTSYLNFEPENVQPDRVVILASEIEIGNAIFPPKTLVCLPLNAITCDTWKNELKSFQMRPNAIWVPEIIDFPEKTKDNNYKESNVIQVVFSNVITPEKSLLLRYISEAIPDLIDFIYLDDNSRNKWISFLDDGASSKHVIFDSSNEQESIVRARLALHYGVYAIPWDSEINHMGFYDYFHPLSTENFKQNKYFFIGKSLRLKALGIIASKHDGFRTFENESRIYSRICSSIRYKNLLNVINRKNTKNAQIQTLPELYLECVFNLSENFSLPFHSWYMPNRFTRLPEIEYNFNRATDKLKISLTAETYQAFSIIIALNHASNYNTDLNDLYNTIRSFIISNTFKYPCDKWWYNRIRIISKFFPNFSEIIEIQIGKTNNLNSLAELHNSISKSILMGMLEDADSSGYTFCDAISRAYKSSKIALDISPKNTESLKIQAMTHFANGNISQGSRVVDMIYHISPKIRGLNGEGAIYYFNHNKGNTALDEVLKLTSILHKTDINLNRSTPDNVIHYALITFLSGKIQESIAITNKIYSVNSSMKDVFFILANEFISNGNYKFAATLLESEIKRSSHSVKTINTLGELYSSCGYSWKQLITFLNTYRAFEVDIFAIAAAYLETNLHPKIISVDDLSNLLFNHSWKTTRQSVSRFFVSVYTSSDSLDYAIELWRKTSCHLQPENDDPCHLCLGLTGAILKQAYARTSCSQRDLDLEKVRQILKSFKQKFQFQNGFYHLALSRIYIYLNNDWECYVHSTYINRLPYQDQLGILHLVSDYFLIDKIDKSALYFDKFHVFSIKDKQHVLCYITLGLLLGKISEVKSAINIITNFNRNIFMDYDCELISYFWLSCITFLLGRRELSEDIYDFVFTGINLKRQNTLDSQYLMGFYKTVSKIEPTIQENLLSGIPIPNFTTKRNKQKYFEKWDTEL